MISQAHIDAGQTLTVKDMTPPEVWHALSTDPNTALVDVRSRAEWTFVGVPDLSELNRTLALVEWRHYPVMDINPQFLDAVDSRLEGETIETLYFICRSGARSREAADHYRARATEAGASVRCVNVAEGFEGDLNHIGQRGHLNGWKARGLAWRQS